MRDGSARSTPGRLARTLALLLLLISLCSVTSEGVDNLASYPRFCASCGFAGVDTFASRSGQFVVHGSTMPVRVPATNSPTLVTLEPQLVVITAERTKRTVGHELAQQDNFADKVHITVLDRAPVGQPVAVVSEIFSDGFLYKVGIPRTIEHEQFAKALTRVVLLEIANRGVRRCAELPLWLVEGMTRQAFTSVLPTYVVNERPMTIEMAGYDRLGDSRSFLRTNSAMTIQELSFPDFSKFNGEERERFETSAHLLVHRLLSLPNGRALMARFIQLLPRTLNWQTALFLVYREHFNSPLQFEKWWMLNWLEFKNREKPQHWTVDQGLERLDAVLLTTMEVRTSTNSIPEFREVPLQQVLQTADFGLQKDLFGLKLQQMFFMSVNVPTELAPLWSAYQRALDSYVQKRSLGEYQPALKSDPEQREQFLVRSILKALNELDRARAEMKAHHVPKDLARK